jgi:DNA processing protein
MRAMDAVVPPELRRRAFERADLASEQLSLAAGQLGASSSLQFQGDPDYPAALGDLPDPPVVLYALGTPSITGPVVAVVGTRDATAYGERVTREIAGSLARAGAVIVSGMARGIDSAAHRAALEAGGSTIAVLGTGVDRSYPVGNRPLHWQIAREGLLLSETPPGAGPTRGSFPRRNRIIAALAQLTIVVEAGRKSGALITAAHGLELGRSVAAVPGPVDSPQSAGANELLRDGAIVIAEAADALALVGLTAPAAGARSITSEDERAVWDALGRGPMDLDSLAANSALPARRCMAAVTALEIAGAVECALTGEIRRR